MELERSVRSDAEDWGMETFTLQEDSELTGISQEALRKRTRARVEAERRGADDHLQRLVAARWRHRLLRELRGEHAA